MRRLVRAIALGTLAAYLALPSTAIAATVTLGVQETDTSAYPTVRIRVTLPPEALGAEAEEMRFTALENGVALSQVDAEPVSSDQVQEVVLVLDASGSMKGEPLVDAQAAAEHFLNVLGPAAQVAVVKVGSKPSILSAFTSDREVIRSTIRSLSAGGGSAVFDSLGVAASLPALTTPNAHRTIVLLSDGSDRGSAAGLNETVRRLVAAKTSVLAVTLQSAETNNVALQTLAAGTGGRLLSASDSSGLLGSFEAAAREIDSRYDLTFVSNKPRTKDVDVDLFAEGGASKAVARLAFPNPLLATLGTGSPAATVRLRTNRYAAIGAVLAAFGFAALGFFGLFTLLFRDRTSMDQLRFYDQLKGGTEGGGKRVDPTTAKMLDAVGYVAGKRELTQLIRSRLEAAGLPIRPVEFITGHLVSVLIVGVALQLLSGRFSVSLLGIIVAAVAPLLYLSFKATQRLNAFELQLPDVLTLIAGSLRAGWGMQQAIDHVVAEASAPASQEFKRAQTEARLGMSLDDALESMAARMGSADFTWAVSAIAIQREVGGNLAEVLDIVAATIRDRTVLRRHVSSLTAEGRLSAIILFVLPFVEGLILVIVNPRYMERLVGEPLGIGMVVAGLVLLLIGGFWLRAVTNVEV